MNLPLLFHMGAILSDITEVKVGFVISMPLLLVAALNFVFIPFSFKPITKPFFVFLFLASSLVSYGALMYGVVFDQGMIQNIAETNVSEAASYLNVSMFIWFLATGVLPAILLVDVEIQYPATVMQGLTYRFLSMFVSLAVMLAIAGLYLKAYMSVGRNNPSLAHEIIPANYLASAVKYFTNTYLRKKPEFRKIAPDANRSQNKLKPLLMFLVVGETARAENFAWNGYPRNTTPYTDQLNEVISFNRVQSCATYTAASVPCMFSDMDRKEFDKNKAKYSENILDVLQKTGVDVVWIENDGGCKGVCDRIMTNELDPKEKSSLCNGDSCYDEAMLTNIDEVVENLEGDKLVVFHMMGSHGPSYYQRYPESHRYFVPDCQRNDIENCTDEQLVNTYDNTIRYTDFVLSQMIDKLKEYKKDYDTVLLYVSDHGESLGEKGLYLHGTPYAFAPEQQTKVPFMLWMSPGYIQDRKINMGCMSELATEGDFSHDNLFSTMLKIWNVNTALYNRKQDVFAACQ
ncbi:MAG: phosphoethanolamine--lipid A transferase [Burkholderiales bacterium]|nr:phosphoethanolamine--lipid A transferase [Burkholderiales bacterium]